MLAAFTQNPEVDHYLRSFPRAQWQRCLELTVALGVQTAKKKFPYGVTLEALSRAVEKPSQTDQMDPSAMLEKLRKIKVEITEEAAAPNSEHKGSSKDPTPEKRVVRAESKNGILKQRQTSGMRQLRIPEAGKKETEVHSRHGKQEIEEKQKEQGQTDAKTGGKHAKSTPEHKTGPDRVNAAELPMRVPYDDIDDEDAKETRIKPYVPKSHPNPQVPSKKPEISLLKADLVPSRSTFKPSTPSYPPDRPSRVQPHPPHESHNSSALTEPKTNQAYVGKLTSAYESKKAREKPEVESSILRITDEFLSDPFMATLSSQTSPKLFRAQGHW